MHPILGHPRRFATYLVVWSPLAAPLGYVLRARHGITLPAAVLLALPLCLLYAIVCLSAWYPCRVTPIDRSGFDRLVFTHLGGAVVAAGAWTAVASGLAWLLANNFPEYQGLNNGLRSELSLILVPAILLYLVSVLFYYALISLQASKEAEARVMQASALARDAELRALKAQVNPHFLFNSLNSISALTSSDAPKAREMCILLGDFLRRTLGLGEKQAIPLEEEMSLIRAFLAVEKIRFGARIRMEEAIDKEALEVRLPPLLLQPLVENAVVHGIANLVEGGAIRLSARCVDGELAIVIENSFDPEAPQRRRNGVGLANVRQRLQARYGNRASFGANAKEDSFCVAITLPIEREESAR
jgi:two-component system sensor histidine kinase AlgZ